MAAGLIYVLHQREAVITILIMTASSFKYFCSTHNFQNVLILMIIYRIGSCNFSIVV